MELELQRDLARCETDVEGTLSRFASDESLYVKCLGLFLDDPTMLALEQALREESWDEAFTAAHALKGLAGNMGFIPLFHASAELVMLIRAGRVKEISGSFEELKRCYEQISAVIRAHCREQGKGV